ncbi:hypothetical protein ACG9XS_20095, partial [Acinetobacter gyllenbergii]
PIGCAVDFVCRLLHLKIISLKKPLQIGLCNKADYNYWITVYAVVFTILIASLSLNSLFS